jgi:23S rRNA (guanosine2251-2'-O)-methyltransferase
MIATIPFRSGLLILTFQMFLLGRSSRVAVGFSSSLISFPRQRGVVVTPFQRRYRPLVRSLAAKFESPGSDRIQLLHDQLESIGVNAEELAQASLCSIKDPTLGYDSNYGKSAIKTYRAFAYPKKSDTNDSQEEDLVALTAQAGRTARQVDFLTKRHKSHQTEWVRHHDALQKERRVFPLILVLDNLRSAFNVGSLYRTADACGCQEVFTCGITPHPNGSGADKLQKSALGAESLVPSRHFATTQQAVDCLREKFPDLKIIGMETTAKSEIYTQVDYDSYRISGVALVLGNEVTGVDTEIISSLDAIVEIPTFGAKNSLNVAACAPVVLYEILRQWKVE